VQEVQGAPSGPQPGPSFGAVYTYDYAEAAPAPEKPRPPKPPARSSRTLADLDKPPSLLSGVGPATVEQLARLGVTTVRDLLWHLPVRHDDYSRMRTISQLEPGEQVTVVANLWEVRERKVGFNRQLVQGILSDGTGTLHATWWNKYVLRQLKPNTTLRFSGKVGLYMGQKTLDNPAFEDADAESISTGRLAPVYPLTEGLTHKRLRAIVRQALDEFAPVLPDPLPAGLRAQYDLLDLPAALWQMHFPDDHDRLQAARRRLAFEEFFYVQLGVQQRRRLLKQVAAAAFPDGRALVEQFAAALPFELTGAQRRVLGEVADDMARPVPMTRMVQGDVGSGKTAVAAGGMWIAAAHGAQAALLAPTQILAEQHHRSLSRLLAPLSRPDGRPLAVELLTGRVAGGERERVLAALREGEADVVVGTTALIQEGVEFANLGFVVVDEQHRFGVEQRGVLRSKAPLQPHVLVMSATPIPRSLSLTVYGDLDVSRLDEMPPGRTPVVTKFFRPTERERLYSFLRREAREGRQAFIVYPLVEESDTLDVGAATAAYERLKAEVFPDLRLELLHGQMPGGKKDEVMRAFADRQADVLVSTSVIEVGIDVPNASLMIIEDAERFGLAQIHQFRGRVGRGEAKSYCALVSASENAAAEERLRIAATISDGFALAEKDLELRGPGDFLGTRQSGLPDLRVAHLGDIETLTLAREAAQSFFAEDPDLAAYPELARQVARFWRGEGDIS
jgi:ATP-dependent DNA helicase RecG